MNALSILKQAIRDDVELTEPMEIYELGISIKDYVLITEKLGLTSETPLDVRQCVKARDLETLIKNVDKLLLLEEKFKTERRIGQKFTQDFIPANFPWSVLKKLRDDLEAQLVRRRTLVVEGLSLIAKDQVAQEMERVEEKARIKATPKMEQKKRRRTLSWYRNLGKKKK